MYEFAAYFREWNVEQEGGLIHRMTYDQFWSWMEWQRLTGFLNEGDRHAAQVLSKLHNVNVTKESQLLKASDFMPKSVDEITQEELAKEESEPDIQSDLLSFNQHVANLKALGKPVQTIKV